MDPLAELFLRYAARGDVGALGEVFDRTAPKLLHLAMHLAHTAEDAEDLLQATFVLAMRKAEAFDGAHPLLPWLSGILAGEARNLARRNAHRRADELPELAAGDGGPVAAAERRELLAQLREHVEALPGEQRQALLLQLQHGLSPASIAEVLDVPPGTVRMRLHRGLQALRKLLPSGLALWLFGALGTRGLAAVRTSVMREAGALRTTVAGGAAVAAGVVTMKYAVGAVAVLLAAFLCWWLAPPSEPAPAPRDAHGSAQVVAAGSKPDAGNATPVERTEASAEGNAERREAIGSLRVRVATNDGDVPLRDVAVRFWPGEQPRPLHDPSNRFARTNDDGLAQFDNLPPGRWQLVASGFRAPAVSVTIAPGAATEHALAMPAHALRGVVVDDGGAPVAGAAVRVGRHPQAADPWQEASAAGRLDVTVRVAALSAADGTFACAAGDEEDCVAATHAGYRSSLSQLTNAGLDSWRLVLLPHATSLGGRVVDRQHRPIAGAFVAARVFVAIERAVDGTWQGPPLAEFATTDASGRFRLPGLPVGGTQLEASAAGFAGAEEFATTMAGGATEDLEIVLAPAIRITGTVRSADGSLLHDLVVDAVRDVPERWKMATSPVQGDGRFAFADLPAPFVLAVRGNATVALASHAVAASGERTLHVDIVLPARPTLRGRLLDDGDRPLAHWFVVVRDDTSKSVAWTRTDERGEFAVPHVIGERVRVSARGPLAMEDETVLADVSPLAGEVVLRVPADRLPRASIAGRLVDHAGQPIAGATMYVRVDEPLHHEAVTGSDGAFCIRGLAAGSYALVLKLDERAWRNVRTVKLAAAEALELGNVQLLPMATLRVEIVQGNGAPWRGMLPQVVLRRPDENWPEWLPRLEGATSEGVVEPGPMRIGLDGEPDLIVQALDVELLPGERRALRMPVAIGRSVSLVFRGDGVPTTGKIDAKDRLQVEVADQGGAVVLREEVRRSPHGDGDWTLEHTFPIGEYTVTARTDSDRRYRGAFVAAESMPERRIVVPRQP